MTSKYLVRAVAAIALAAIAASAPAAAGMGGGKHVQIIIETVPQSRQAYDTAGDWRWRNGTLHITVSAMSNWRYEALVAIHETVEALLCRSRGVSEQAVTAWDTGPGKRLDDPGDDPRSPYHAEHVAATRIEREFAKELAVNWRAYDREVTSK
jgi:hypothetical protein